MKFNQRMLLIMALSFITLFSCLKNIVINIEDIKTESRHSRFSSTNNDTTNTQHTTLKNKMIGIHHRVNRKFNQKQIRNFYNQEKRSEQIYGGKILDIKKDYKKLKMLFPARTNERRDRVMNQLRTKIIASKVKLIFIDRKNENSNSKFEADDCNVKKCRFTSDHSHIPYADAVCWQGFMPEHILRKKVRDSQIFINSQIEGAGNHGLFSEGKGLNWTASYRRDSVLNTPYERFTPYTNVTNLPNKTVRNYGLGKTKKIAWFVSNCVTSNNRINYVKELQKHIQVDIYGRCGKLKCPTYDKATCYDMLKKDYKFYLSFENCNCKDFVSEKFFINGLSNDILPIVMGAHPDDYKHIAPPNSYIHIDEFSSPRQLARYLHFLDQNDQYYNEYFLWKGTGRFINTKFMCRLCTMVHLAEHFPMWYKDSNAWWLGLDTCVTPTVQNGIDYSSWRGKSSPQNNFEHIQYGQKK